MKIARALGLRLRFEAVEQQPTKPSASAPLLDGPLLNITEEATREDR